METLNKIYAKNEYVVPKHEPKIDCFAYLSRTKQ